MQKIIAVIGPTASGKTALGVRLAQEFGGAIVSADAKQVYRRMNIGTAKELNLPIPQYLVDLKEPGERVTVAEYQALAYAKIDELLGTGVLPILVGGSGLYAESVTEGYLFGGPGSKEKSPRYKVLKLGIDIPREELKQRAVTRVGVRLEQGMVEEVRELLARGVSPEWLESCGIEYRYVTQYVRGEITYEEMEQNIATATVQFIKRQYTWWRRHDDVVWVQSYADAKEYVVHMLNR